MGRLIDADELLKEIEKAALEVEKKMKDRRTGKTLAQGLAQGCLTGLACVREAVKRQPTACVPDKVVQQLEEFRPEMEQFGCGGMLTDIIDVVKAGGIDAEH